MKSGPAVRPRPGHRPFTVAHARADHWGLAAKGCLETIAAAAADSNLGILYATETFAPNLSSILTFLRETTRIEQWVGAVAPGICAVDTAYREGGALAVMVGWLPEDGFRCFSGVDANSIRQALGPWPGQGDYGLGLVHGDPRNPALAAMVAEAVDTAFLVGGLISAAGPPAQVAHTVVSGGLSGLMLSSGIEVVTGLTQGCSPIGPVHEITDGWDGVVMGLDDRSALEVLKEEAGDLIARNLRRAAGYIHVGLPMAGSDTGDYRVRTLLGIDPRQGWLAIGERVAVGDRLMFVRRDANTARADLARMAAGVARRVGGRPVRAAFYFTCVGRGAHMFGDDAAELEMLRSALGDVPLIGFFANGEISGHSLYGYTGVLAVLPGPAP